MAALKVVHIRSVRRTEDQYQRGPEVCLVGETIRRAGECSGGPSFSISAPQTSTHSASNLEKIPGSIMGKGP